MRPNREDAIAPGAGEGPGSDVQDIADRIKCPLLDIMHGAGGCCCERRRTDSVFARPQAVRLGLEDAPIGPTAAESRAFASVTAMSIV